MYCTNCGQKLNDQARFCTLCGSPVNAEAQNANTAPEAQSINTVLEAQSEPDTSPDKQASDPSNTNVQQTSFKSALDSSKKKSKRRIPTIVLVALITLLLSSVAYATYRIYTDIIAPQQTQEQQAETVVEEPESPQEPEQATEPQPTEEEPEPAIWHYTDSYISVDLPLSWADRVTAFPAGHTSGTYFVEFYLTINGESDMGCTVLRIDGATGIATDFISPWVSNQTYLQTIGTDIWQCENSGTVSGVFDRYTQEQVRALVEIWTNGTYTYDQLASMESAEAAQQAYATEAEKCLQDIILPSLAGFDANGTLHQ